MANNFTSTGDYIERDDYSDSSSHEDATVQHLLDNILESDGDTGSLVDTSLSEDEKSALDEFEDEEEPDEGTLLENRLRDADIAYEGEHPDVEGLTLDDVFSLIQEDRAGAFPKALAFLRKNFNPFSTIDGTPYKSMLQRVIGKGVDDDTLTTFIHGTAPDDKFTDYVDAIMRLAPSGVGEGGTEDLSIGELFHLLDLTDEERKEALAQDAAEVEEEYNNITDEDLRDIDYSDLRPKKALSPIDPDTAEEAKELAGRYSGSGALRQGSYVPSDKNIKEDASRDTQKNIAAALADCRW